jgi:hypothetical protein
MTISNAEIVAKLKLLADYHIKVDNGSTTTAVSSNLVGEAGIANQYACFISGNNIGTDRVISGFFTETGTIEFAALDNAVDSTTEICICKIGFQSDVFQASLIVANDFRNKGLDIDLFLTTSQLKELYIYKTIELVCAGLMNDGVDTDVYYVHYNRFKSLYENEISTLMADYDANEDGTIQEDEENTSTSYGIFAR